MKHRRLRTVLTLVTLVALLLGAAGRAAGETAVETKARKLFQQGMEHVKRGEYARALLEFKAAHVLTERASIIFNIARCHHKLGQVEDAVRNYRRYLEQWKKDHGDTPIPRREEVERALAELTAPKAPPPKPPASRPAPPPASRPVASHEEVEPKPSPQPDLGTERSVELDALARERRSKTIWGYTSLGVAAACAVTAGVLYGVGKSQGSDAYQRYSDARKQTEINAHWSDVEAAHVKLTAGHVMVGVAAVAAGVALWQLLTRPAEQPAVTVGAPRWSGLSFAGVF